MQPTPVVRLNRAAAMVFAEGAGSALKELEAMRDELDHYQPYHAALADCLRRAGRQNEAALAYRRAIKLSSNHREQEFLQRQLQKLPGTKT